MSVPDGFRDEFSSKGETFFEIAELLYTHPTRQYTQDELADIMDCSTTTISNHTSKMVKKGWLERHENQTTFAWDSDAHNPASTEGTTALTQFYVDLWKLLKKHSATTPGAFAITGFAMGLSAIVLFSFYVGVSLDLMAGSAIPPFAYGVLAGGFFISGAVVSFLSPVQAVLNRFVWRFIPRESQ